MMQISNTATVNYSTYTEKKEIEYDNDHGTMDQTDFLNLFVTQLQNQDPTSPMDDSAMMEQTATFSQIELMQSMEASLKTIAGGSEAVNQQQLMMSAAGYIGKLVEYEGDKTYLSNGAAAVTFEPEKVPFRTTVVVKDEKGEFVTSFEPPVYNDDMNTFYWDGTDSNGNAMPNGKYSFSVVAIDTDGEKIDVKTYGNGLVTGVKTVDGSMVYEVDGSDVAADKVTSVRDAAYGGVL